MRRAALQLPSRRRSVPIERDGSGEPSAARVLSVTTSDSRRGAEVFAVDLARELVRKGIEIDVVALSEGEGAARLDIEVLGPSRRSLRTLFALRQRARHYDLVIANGSTTLPVAALATLGTDTPFIYRNVGDPRYWSARPGRRRRTQLALRRASAVVALTRETGYALRECYGVPPTSIRAIPKAAPATLFPPTNAELRQLRRLQQKIPDGPVVLYAGALAPEKRPDLAIRAVAASKCSPTLLVVGDGPLRQDVERAAAEHLAPDQARFLGQVPDVSIYLQAADVLLLPSDTEGLPGVAIEAGLTGLPVVATDVGWIREIVVHQETGLITTPGAAAELGAAVDEALLRRDDFGAAGRARCLARFEIASVGREWLSLVQTVASR